jgi:hypothetical protein
MWRNRNFKEASSSQIITKPLNLVPLWLLSSPDGSRIIAAPVFFLEPNV